MREKAELGPGAPWLEHQRATNREQELGIWGARKEDKDGARQRKRSGGRERERLGVEIFLFSFLFFTENHKYFGLRFLAINKGSTRYTANDYTLHFPNHETEKSEE
jgi:hypothetical protein